MTTELLKQARDALDLTRTEYGIHSNAVCDALIAIEQYLEQEDDALSKPASEDAWLRKSLQLTANIRDATDDESSAAYFDQLEHHLRTRPAREGFVSVNEQTIRAAAEVMEKEFANLGNFSCTKEVWADKIRGWLFIRGPVEDALRKAMIEAAKESGK